jgi:4-amino-4-deoxy-L-arabinose transferase-like glycosyltransferase
LSPDLRDIGRPAAALPGAAPPAGQAIRLLGHLAVPALLALLYLPALGSSAAGTHPDEWYYLGIGAEMQAAGRWLTPTLGGQPLWFKPPLLYWAQHLSYAAFGRGFLGGRLPAALAAIALALLTGALARRMYGGRAGALAALLTGGTFGWVKFGRIAMMDAPLALAFTAAAYGAWRAAEEDRPPLVLWAGVGGAAAFLLKGPVGALIVLLLAGGYLALRRPALLASLWTTAAFGLGAALGLPWYVASLLVHGRRFYDFFVVEQNFDRFRHPWTLSGEATLLVGFAVFLLPWTLLALGNLPPPRRWREPQMLLPVLWIGAVLGVFTLPALKWPHYGLGCAPAAALLACHRPPPRWAAAGTALILAALALAALAALRWPLPLAGAAALLGVSLAFALAAAFTWRDELVGAAAAAVAGFALVTGALIPALDPPVIPPAALARLDGRELRLYGAVPGLFTLAAGRPVRRVEGPELQPALDRGEVVIFAGPGLDRLPAAERARLAEVAAWDRIRPRLGAQAVLQSWAARDPSLLLEPVTAVERRR